MSLTRLTTKRHGVPIDYSDIEVGNILLYSSNHDKTAIFPILVDHIEYEGASRLGTRRRSYVAGDIIPEFRSHYTALFGNFSVFRFSRAYNEGPDRGDINSRFKHYLYVGGDKNCPFYYLNRKA